jgi:hypothetical protein
MLKKGVLGTFRSAAGTFGCGCLSTAGSLSKTLAGGDFQFWFTIPHTLPVMS